VEDWISKNITINFDGVSQKKDWAINGVFNSTYDPWVYKSSNHTEIINKGWTNPGSVCINVTNGPKSEGEYGYFEQNVSIPEFFTPDKLVTLGLWYYYNPTIFLSPENISMFISVIIGGVENNYSIDFINLVKYNLYPFFLTYDPIEIGQEIPNNVTLRIGVIVNNNTNVLGPGNLLYMGGVKFLIWTKPNQPNLISVLDCETSFVYAYQNFTFGKGQSFINMERKREETSEILFTVSQNVTDIEEFEIFNITISSNIVKIFNSTIDGTSGSMYTKEENISWQTYCSIAFPYNYFNNWLEIEKPRDWNVIHLFDGYNIDQIESCSGLDYGFTKVIIPKGVVNQGLWTLEAISQNYITSGNIMVWNGTNFNVSPKIFVGEIFQINVILNDTIDFKDTLVNSTIFYPNGTIFWQDVQEIDSLTVTLSNITVGTFIPIGDYQVMVEWTNNKSYLNRNKVGFLEFNFEIWHHTSLTAVTPYIRATSGESLLVKINYNDQDLNTYIESATIKCNSSFGEIGIMADLGSGIYFIEINTTPLELGNHYLSFNASKEYYENQLINSLINCDIVPVSHNLIPIILFSILASISCITPITIFIKRRYFNQTKFQREVRKLKKQLLNAIFNENSNLNREDMVKQMISQKINLSKLIHSERKHNGKRN
jgi:hypothetical protein